METVQTLGCFYWGMSSFFTMHAQVKEKSRDQPGICEFPQAEHLMYVQSSSLLLAGFADTLVGCSLYESFVVSCG